MSEVRLPDIRAHFSRSIGSTSDPELTALVLDSVMEAMPTILSHVRGEERKSIVDRLRALADGRMDYVGKKVEHAGDIETMTPLQATVYGEATGARRLARIIAGEIDDKGWLPSWRWSQ